MQRFSGGCHCGDVEYALDWPEGRDLPLRKCNCTFCIKHGAIYTGHAKATLAVTVRAVASLSEYHFGTGTGRFHYCARCGVFLFATCRIDGRAHAVLNVNTLKDYIPPASIETRNYEGESVPERLARRSRTWIPSVTVTTAA